jgi:cell wall-associated NlpC family hydrolase
MGKVINIKRAAVALGVELKLSGYQRKPPFGVTMAEIKGNEINALLAKLSRAKMPIIQVHDPAYWMEWFLEENDDKHNIKWVEFRPIQYGLPPGETDCSGLVACAFKRAGWADPMGNNYSGYGNTDTLRAHGTKVPIASIKRNDLVHYSNPNHVALYVGNGEVISHGQPGDPTRKTMTYRPIYEVTRNT